MGASSAVRASTPGCSGLAGRLLEGLAEGRAVGSTSPNESSTSVSQLFARMCEGDRAACDRLLVAYFPRLIGLARKTLGSRAAGVVDPEDAVQSAVTAFWRQTQRGKFAAGIDRNELWTLLAVFTRRKALKHLEREDAAKR